MSVSWLDTIEITPCQRRVYQAAMQIPRGRVTTYRWLGLAIECRSPRAIGQALKRNPFAPRVPCHRIVSSDLSIGGFSGQTSGSEIAKKRQLLSEEGVVFQNGRIADPARVFTFWLES